LDAIPAPMLRRPEVSVPERDCIRLRSVGSQKYMETEQLKQGRRVRRFIMLWIQNGLTTARMTIAISRTVGISLMIR
jgi:hypothetical protein